MRLRVFDADDEPGGDWLLATDAFALAVSQGTIPVAIPIRVDGRPTLATVLFAPKGRVGDTAAWGDDRQRARLAVGLMMLARSRVTDQLGATGVVAV